MYPGGTRFRLLRLLRVILPPLRAVISGTPPCGAYWDPSAAWTLRHQQHGVYETTHKPQNPEQTHIQTIAIGLVPPSRQVRRVLQLERLHPEAHLPRCAEDTSLRGSDRTDGIVNGQLRCRFFPYSLWGSGSKVGFASEFVSHLYIFPPQVT